jgi:hypothetical protein
LLGQVLDDLLDRRSNRPVRCRPGQAIVTKGTPARGARLGAGLIGCRSTPDDGDRRRRQFV